MLRNISILRSCLRRVICVSILPCTCARLLPLEDGPYFRETVLCRVYVSIAILLFLVVLATQRLSGAKKKQQQYSGTG